MSAVVIHAPWPVREVVIHLRGEIDIDNVADLRTAVRCATHQRGATIVVDCAQLGFIDAVGLGVLAGLAATASDQGRSAIIRHPSAFLRRLLRLTNLDHRFEVEPQAPAPGCARVRRRPQPSSAPGMSTAPAT